MTYLLDTATLLWAVAAPDRLSARSRKLIEAGTHTLVVSIASLPGIHRDPFDRILIAQALTEGWPPIL